MLKAGGGGVGRSDLSPFSSAGVQDKRSNSRKASGGSAGKTTTGRAASREVRKIRQLAELVLRKRRSC
jgi:hypothetical protein